MAITTNTVEPTDRNVNLALGEWQTGRIIGDDPALIFVGAGAVGAVQNNIAVAGTVDFHDSATAAGVSAANRIMRLDTTNDGQLNEYEFVVRSGLVVVTSAATNDVTYQLRGAPTLSPVSVPGTTLVSTPS